MEHTQSRGVLGNRAIRMLALLNVAIYDATIAAWDTKYAYNRPRPSDGNPGLAAIPTPASPSYPATSTPSRPAPRRLFLPRSSRLTQRRSEPGPTKLAPSRLEAAVAYPSDVSAGLDLGRQVGERAVARGRADGSGCGVAARRSDRAWQVERHKSGRAPRRYLEAVGPHERQPVPPAHRQRPIPSRWRATWPK